VMFLCALLGVASAVAAWWIMPRNGGGEQRAQKRLGALVQND
jgi:hypothetical protein